MTGAKTVPFGRHIRQIVPELGDPGRTCHRMKNGETEEIPFEDIQKDDIFFLRSSDSGKVVQAPVRAAEYACLNAFDTAEGAWAQFSVRVNELKLSDL